MTQQRLNETLEENGRLQLDIAQRDARVARLELSLATAQDEARRLREMQTAAEPAVAVQEDTKEHSSAADIYAQQKHPLSMGQTGAVVSLLADEAAETDRFFELLARESADMQETPFSSTGTVASGAVTAASLDMLPQRGSPSVAAVTTAAEAAVREAEELARSFLSQSRPEVRPSVTCRMRRAALTQ